MCCVAVSNVRMLDGILVLDLPPDLQITRNKEKEYYVIALADFPKH